MRNLVYKSNQLKIRLEALLPKKEDNDGDRTRGILAVLQPSEVSVVTYSSRDGLKERVYKVFCGYNVEANRFMHQVESRH